MTPTCANCKHTDASIMGHAVQAACAVCCGPDTPNTKYVLRPIRRMESHKEQYRKEQNVARHYNTTAT